ncbi:fused DSP-PTPase phosphatase/NAD kinase-like protein [Azotosporobacter soli]|uniref:phosphatase domain-containing putative toxin n=1 Tax=Azotosporobacter soli TaxID=3055040 RepID=UPI0031FF1DA0
MNYSLVRNIVFSFFVLSAVLFSDNSLLLAAEPAPGLQILKLDRPISFNVPENFRRAQDPFKLGTADGYMPTRRGLDALRISGSRFFSQPELTKILYSLPEKDVVILDLRGEAHGYLNGNGMSWYSAYKRINFGKTAAVVEAEENKLLAGVAKQEVEVATLGKDKSVVAVDMMQVQQTLSERELAARNNVKYYRIPVSDYTPPTAENVEQFLAFYKNLPADAWVHLHCEAGEGRTTTFMAMIDMIHNANRVSYDDIMIRQWLLGGQDIRSATDNDPWKKEAYKKRAAFTKLFYAYVQQNPKLDLSWNDWLLKQRQ